MGQPIDETIRLPRGEHTAQGRPVAIETFAPTINSKRQVLIGMPGHLALTVETEMVVGTGLGIEDPLTNQPRLAHGLIPGLAHALSVMVWVTLLQTAQVPTGT